ncbi:N-acetylmuramoyl-L-alanine amidase [Lachnospiraceae bacterium NSJ-143]|nr:N-acetylmuramoyl-L-alanine amidase [Lachnospiraceae bacterium NSJ-143]
MPRVFLSPSVQEYNEFLSGGNEEYYMNLIADAMEPYLEASGIDFGRNDRNKPVSQAIADSNAGNYDLHLAIHSNAAPEGLKGKLSGADIYYSPVSYLGKMFADMLAENYRTIYPNPDKVNTIPTTSLGEITRTIAPAVLIETAYHDNPEDEAWLKDNIDNIARVLAMTVAEFFNLPFVEPMLNDNDYEIEVSMLE